MLRLSASTSVCCNLLHLNFHTFTPNSTSSLSAADILHDSVEVQRQKRTQTILNAAFKLKMGARPKQPMSARERLNFAFATNFDFEDDSDDSDNSQDDSDDEKDDGLKDDETDSSAESDDGLDPPQLAKSDIAQVRKTKSKAYRKAKELHKHEWTPEELEQLVRSLPLSITSLPAAHGCSTARIAVVRASLPTSPFFSTRLAPTSLGCASSLSATQSSLTSACLAGTDALDRPL